MPYDYPQIQELHILLAVVSMLMIAVRGLGILWGARWPLDSRLRTINGGVDILLTITGLSLWGLLNISPVHHGWLMAKLILLPLYAVLGALACMGLIVGVAHTRDPWLGLA